MTGPSLPVLAAREALLAALERSGVCLLSAPTATGKSTQVPKFLLGRGKVLVLQPRRLACRALAVRVARELGEAVGRTVGYRVRFEERAGPGTAVEFQTYGVFLRLGLERPFLDGVSAVVFDEFHERSAEADLALAWCAALRRSVRPDLRLVVMSATLATGSLRAFLPEAVPVEVTARSWPVEVVHLPPPDDRLSSAVLAGLRAVLARGLSGTCLVFLPGVGEIRRTMADLASFCRAEGLAVAELHGGLTLAEQAAVLEEASGRRVVFATNIAETSLTVPGVTAVVDTGWHRVAFWDAGRQVDVLRLERIGEANREQRTGRAGRTGPGFCVRLWSVSERLRPSVPAEIHRVDLARFRLAWAVLSEAAESKGFGGLLRWPEPPGQGSWEDAERRLRMLGGLDGAGRITVFGRRLASWPLSPRLAAVLERVRPEEREAACGIAALLESDERRLEGSVDLAEEARRLVGSPEEFPWTVAETMRRLRGLSVSVGGAEGGMDAWLACWQDRLAGREEGSVYRLVDGTAVRLVRGPRESLPDCLLALSVREVTAAGRPRSVVVERFLAVEPERVERAFPGECRTERCPEIDTDGRLVVEERTVFRGVVLRRRSVEPDPDEAGRVWAERVLKGGEGFGEEAEQTLVRIRLAARLMPEEGFPAMDEEDVRLVCEEAYRGLRSWSEVRSVPLAEEMRRYLGGRLAGILERELPTRMRLVSGRTARVRYFEDRAAEVAARITDLAGTRPFRLCRGRLGVVFDILAPNGRTVQKTADLEAFWVKDYPGLKRSLMRRYPKHPWP